MACSLPIDFQNHGGDQLNQITAVSNTCPGRLRRRTKMHRWSAHAKAGFNPALHASALEKSTSRTAAAVVEHAPAQLLVKSREVDIGRRIGPGGCQ
jgi:hypothetical protein